MADKIRACASRTDEVYLKCKHDLAPDGKGFLNTVEFDTLKPNSDRGYSGRINGSDAGVANICMLRYRQRKLDAYRTLILDTASGYLKADMDMTNAVRPGAFGSVIWLMLNAHDLTDDKQYLDRADYFARKAVMSLMGDGSPLPMANTKYDHYEAVTGGDTLMMSLLKLWVVQNRPGMKLNLTFNNR